MFRKIITHLFTGGYATKHPGVNERVFFGAGAGAFSTLWFYGLALLSALMAPLMKSPRAMRVISFVAAVVLSILAVKLGREI